MKGLKNLKFKVNKFFISFEANLLVLAPVVFADDADASGASTAEFYATAGEIVGVLSWVAFAIALFKAIQIGIMFVLSAGGKAKAKEAILPWLIGAFVCATFGIIGPIIMDLFFVDKGVFQY